MGIFASAVMFSALCQNLLVTCEVSESSKTVCIHGSVDCLRCYSDGSRVPFTARLSSRPVHWNGAE